jgi:hypothetical protein
MNRAHEKRCFAKKLDPFNHAEAAEMVCVWGPEIPHPHLIQGGGLGPR